MLKNPTQLHLKMSSTTLLLDSTELEKTAILEEDDQITLFKASNRANGKLYTLTILCGNQIESISTNLQQELRIIQDLDHRNIVKCYEVCTRNDGIHFLHEFLTSQSLRGSHITDESSLRYLTHRVLLALSHLHQRKIVHGEIRPSRFFVNNRMACVKILYLGQILQLLKSSEDANHHPDRMNSLDGFAGDVWSLGLSILELYLGSFSDDIENPCSVPEVPSTASAEFRDFISCCLQKDPAKKWTADQLLHHPFILQSTSSNNLQGHLLEEETEVQRPFLSSSSSSFSSSMDFKEIKLSESAVQLSTEPEIRPNDSKTVSAAVECGKSAEKNVKSNQRIQGGFKRSISDHSLLVQRCAKRKRLKAKADIHDKRISKELSEVNANNSSHKKEEKKSECSRTESEEIEFRQKQRMRFLERAKEPRRILQGADFEFESLPEYVKRCLLHCSLFPMSYEFEKDALVQLWIAEELIDLEVTERMEDDGKVCFDILTSTEFIVPSSYDNLYGRPKYKVNESKAPYWYPKGGLSRGGYLRIEDQLNDTSEMPLHLSLDMEEFDLSALETLKNFKHLRTLLLLGDHGSSIKQIPRDFFLCLNSLCTLDLSRTQISELPSSMGCLELLHYLDLSYTPIKLLPESIDSLYNMQTLKLRCCFALHAVPEGISELINLRHLDLDIVRQLKSMPRGMGNLTNLQTLKAFMVGRDDGYSIGELKNLNNITGSFCIARLENVENQEEAIKADLSTKQFINKLELRWGDHRSDEAPPEAEILECLQPHYGLKELQIQFYNGSLFPSWIGNPSFTNIASITLYKCKNCQVLPSIGRLPSLKILNIVGLDSVRDMDGLLCRNVETGGHNLFPKLEKLTLDNMLNLQGLTGAENDDFPSLLQVHIRYCPKVEDLSLLSHLKIIKYLEMNHCSKLQSLPEGGLPASIERLYIRGCPRIKERCHKNGEDWCKIAHIPGVWIDYEEISQHSFAVVESPKTQER